MAYKLKSIRILLVNSNKPLRGLIFGLLVDLGFGNVNTAGDAESGWQLYCDEVPDILIVDWRMDKNADLDFIRRIRTDPVSPAPHVPIIVITGHTNRERVILARDMGVTEFLTKPFTVLGLARHLMHIIEKPRDFVVSPNFIGPDRRRKLDPVDDDALKRKKDRNTSRDYIPHTGPTSRSRQKTGKE